MNFNERMIKFQKKKDLFIVHNNVRELPYLFQVYFSLCCIVSSKNQDEFL